MSSAITNEPLAKTSDLSSFKNERRDPPTDYCDLSKRVTAAAALLLSCGGAWILSLNYLTEYRQSIQRGPCPPAENVGFFVYECIYITFVVSVIGGLGISALFPEKKEHQA